MLGVASQGAGHCETLQLVDHIFGNVGANRPEGVAGGIFLLCLIQVSFIAVLKMAASVIALSAVLLHFIEVNSLKVSVAVWSSIS